MDPKRDAHDDLHNSINNELRRTFPEKFTLEAEALRQRQLACYPEPPEIDQFRYAGTPFSRDARVEA
jgi:hypothetical protein